MEGRRLLCLFLVIFFSVAAATHLVHGDDAVLYTGSVSATKAYQESRRPPEIKLGGRKLGVAEQFPASKSTVTVANELLCGGGGGRRRSINCERRLRRRFSHEQEWNNNDFVAFINADYKAPRHHPPKNN